MDDVVADELEVGLREQVRDVGLLAGEEVVDADHVVARGHEPVAEMAAEKAGASGHEHALDRGHDASALGMATVYHDGPRAVMPPRAAA
jgi:hypothetical protein